jgi:hypothetical protein
MDFLTETMLLRKANQDIDAGKARIERQKAIVLELEASGHDIESAIALLKSLQGALMAMQQHRLFIRDRIDDLRRRKTRDRGAAS